MTKQNAACTSSDTPRTDELRRDPLNSNELAAWQTLADTLERELAEAGQRLSDGSSKFEERLAAERIQFWERIDDQRKAIENRDGRLAAVEQYALEMRALVDRGYKMMLAAGYRVTEHDPDHDNPIIAWMADARAAVTKNLINGGKPYSAEKSTEPQNATAPCPGRQVPHPSDEQLTVRSKADIAELMRTTPDEAICARCGLDFGEHHGESCPYPHHTRWQPTTPSSVLDANDRSVTGNEK